MTLFTIYTLGRKMLYHPYVLTFSACVSSVINFWCIVAEKVCGIVALQMNSAYIWTKCVFSKNLVEIMNIEQNEISSYMEIQTVGHWSKRSHSCSNFTRRHPNYRFPWLVSYQRMLPPLTTIMVSCLRGMLGTKCCRRSTEILAQ